METEQAQEPKAERERCTQPGCRQVVGLQPGEDGALRCAHHDPVRRAARDKRLREMVAERRRKGGPGLTAELDELPVASIETMEDAVALARWVPVAIATGRLGGREAGAMVAALREYRMALADTEALAKLAALEERIKAARKRGLDI